MSVFNAIALVFVGELQQQQQPWQQQTVTCNELSEAGVEMQVESNSQNPITYIWNSMCCYSKAYHEV